VLAAEVVPEIDALVVAEDIATGECVAKQVLG
jgi:hypothetical protein